MSEIQKAIETHDIEKVRKLVSSSGINKPNDGNTLLHFASKGKNHEIILLLLKNEANPNIQNGNTPFHFACFWKCSEHIIYDFLSFGADIEIKNNKTPLDFIFDLKLKEEFKNFSSFGDEMIQLLERQESGDLKIITKDKTIFGHKIIFETRIGKQLIDQSLKIFEQYNSQEVIYFLKIIYGGRNQDIFTKNKEIADKIGIKNFTNLFGKNSIIQDYSKLYLDENSKDFTIITKDYNIKAHKIILMARSDLFRGMFLYVKDDSNQVHDYSQKSGKSIETLIKFLYSDHLDSNLDKSVYQELQDAHDFYQLSQFSLLPKLLLEMKSKKK
ncbi:ankyrin repeat ph and sec7 domain containing protein secg-related [Anaeramoeba ignava]|uniref:Ankyrin repeat ph and sec7 domain containing protein secg-related n=1 Tax=Anaeramoeba ignava TaxID=1746090 RepID=A0A9Q0LAZ5_ANAIG|nr:ankyrin repeat ph and sec7 domain containing protein secg-related [Anaeramoeba ignava]